MWPTIRSVGFLDIFVSFFYIAYILGGFYNVFHLNDPVLLANNTEFTTIAPETIDPQVPQVSTGTRTGHGYSCRSDARWHVFTVLTHVLLVLRFIAAVVLLGSSFKTEFRKQFKASVFWMFISVVTMTIMAVELWICSLHVVEKVLCILEMIFRVVCAFFVIKFMRYDQDQSEVNEDAVANQLQLKLAIGDPALQGSF